MPWNKVTQMEEVTRFVMLAQSDRFTLTELCEQFGISRKTAYKYLARYAADGMKGLQARSHRMHHCPHRTDTEIEAWILAERRLHRTWGPKKLQVVLETKHGLEAAPACTIASRPSGVGICGLWLVNPEEVD
jgi:transposase